MTSLTQRSFRGCRVRGLDSGKIGLVVEHRKGSHYATVEWRGGRVDTYDVRMWGKFLEVLCGRPRTRKRKHSKRKRAYKR